MPRIYLDLIKLSLESIEPPYFRLSTTYEPSGIVRERVFCYELYHQIRSRMGQEHAITLNGEIDKRGHSDFREEDRRNPDFVFHIPGTHRGNTLIIEVKGSLRTPRGIIDDINTLLTFVSRYHYQAGVFILYNHSLSDLSEILRGRLARLANESCADSIYLLSMKTSRQRCEEIVLAELRENLPPIVETMEHA